MEYTTMTLASGLRLIQRPSPGEVVYCGFAIAAGTASEREGEEGLAHFCEHTSFKGTRRRTARQLVDAVEGLGGELNAYTNKESTVYYCAVTRSHLRVAVDVLTDMVFCSAYPDDEVEREREVVCDEIETYRDQPSELIYDVFEDVVFRGRPLGHNILGTKETVRSFTGEDCRRFTTAHYRPERMVFFLEGEADLAKVAGWIEGSMARGRESDDASVDGQGTSLTAAAAPGCAAEAAPSTAGDGVAGGGVYHQAHVIIGREAYGASHPRRLALYLLNNILGGPAMTSRLNMSLRERHGLVYTVESSMTTYGETGVWTVYFGCDPEDVKRCERLVMRELRRLTERELTPRALLLAKRQLRGQVALACDSRENFALDYARAFLHHGIEKDPEALCRQIDALTATDLLETAREMFAPEGLTRIRL